MFSEGLEAKVNDLALRQHLKIMGVSNFSLGSNFILGRLIYNLVIKFKNHKDCNCQQSVYLMSELLCMLGCVCISSTNNAILLCLICPKAIIRHLCVLYCLCH